MNGAAWAVVIALGGIVICAFLLFGSKQPPTCPVNSVKQASSNPGPATSTPAPKCLVP